MQPANKKSMLNQKSIIILAISFILITTLTLELQATSSDHEIQVLINSKENITLSPGNTIQLMLVDQSVKDHDKTILTSQEWRPDKQMPLKISLELNRSQIEIEKNYLLLAVIKSENQMPVLAGTMKVPGINLLIGS